jgi:hypothetical protein
VDKLWRVSTEVRGLCSGNPPAFLIENHHKRYMAISSNPIFGQEQYLCMYMVFVAWCRTNHVQIFRSFEHLRWLEHDRRSGVVLAMTGLGKSRIPNWVWDGDEVLKPIYCALLDNLGAGWWKVEEKRKQAEELLMSNMIHHLTTLQILRVPSEAP